LKVKDIVFMIL